MAEDVQHDRSDDSEERHHFEKAPIVVTLYKLCLVTHEAYVIKERKLVLEQKRFRIILESGVAYVRSLRKHEGSSSLHS